MTALVPFPSLETERLRLREISSADADDLFAIHGNPELMRFFGCDPLADVAAALDLVATFAKWRTDPNPGIRWAIQPCECDSLIGTCGLFKWNRAWQTCSVGYELSASAHGKGYMREALRKSLSWGFANMDLNRIEAFIHPDNSRSIRLARSLGFQEEGRLREGAFWAGQHHDMLLLSLLRRDWRHPVDGDMD